MEKQTAVATTFLGMALDPVHADSVYASDQTVKEINQWLSAPKPFDIAVTYGTGPWEELGEMVEFQTRAFAAGQITVRKVTSVQNPPNGEWVLAEGYTTYDPSYDIAIAAIDKRGHRSSIPVGYGRFPGQIRQRPNDTMPLRRTLYQYVPMEKDKIDHFLILRRLLRTHIFQGIAPVPLHVPEDLPAS